ncbi:hypothetical protein B0H19DRAFT_1263785 [Mycena capillaripes]|nr:hypothetical protein B0H19DRAFT_1263785 [Mycena capillaripes]
MSLRHLSNASRTLSATSLKDKVSMLTTTPLVPVATALQANIEIPRKRRLQMLAVVLWSAGIVLATVLFLLLWFVYAHHEAYFHDDNYTTLNSIQWMRGCSFEPTPALEAMLALPLAELFEHPLLTDDPLAAHKIFGLGAVFLQLLAIQHSLSEPWDLSVQTFLEIQDGRLVAAPPSAMHALDVMWRAVDPIYVAGDNNLSVPQLVTFETIFRATHTRYFEDSSVIFYEYVWSTTDLPSPPPPPLLPFIRIQRAGKDIRFATDLPAGGVNEGGRGRHLASLGVTGVTFTKPPRRGTVQRPSEREREVLLTGRVGASKCPLRPPRRTTQRRITLVSAPPAYTSLARTRLGAVVGILRPVHHVESFAQAGRTSPHTHYPGRETPNRAQIVQVVLLAGTIAIAGGARSLANVAPGTRATPNRAQIVHESPRRQGTAGARPDPSPGRPWGPEPDPTPGSSPGLG